MDTQKDNLKKLLLFIEELVKDEGNEWFKNELINKLTAHNLNSTTELDSEIIEIRSALQIKGRLSIDYSYVKEERLRQQLIVDNLRMENAALEFKELNEIERFYNFCVNAFFQLENLLNYYYHKQFPKIDELLTHIESTPIDNNFKRSGKERSVSDINIATKIYSFNVEFQSDMNINPFFLNNLNRVRNEGLHRCSILFKEEHEHQLYKFYKNENFSSVRLGLGSISRFIELQLKYY